MSIQASEPASPRRQAGAQPGEVVLAERTVWGGWGPTGHIRTGRAYGAAAGAAPRACGRNSGAEASWPPGKAVHPEPRQGFKDGSLPIVPFGNPWAASGSGPSASCPAYIT